MLARRSGRKRFPAWLYDIVDMGEVEGVRWCDKEKTIFTVPWTRVDSPQFDLAKHARIFQLWAELTGRYKDGERADPSVWKTRFRCAIRKMSEIEEITLPKNLEEKNGKEPFRVFRFKENVLNCTTYKNAKKLKKDRIRHKSKPQNHVNQFPNNNTSRVTARSIYCGSALTQSLFYQRDIVSHGVTRDACTLPGDMTASKAPTCYPYWPVFRSPEITNSKSFQEITIADLSIQPGNNSSIEDEEEQGCFPEISPEDVNDVLRSCSPVLKPVVMTSQDISNALQSFTNVTSHDHDKSMEHQNVAVNGVRTSVINEECMSTSMECLVFDDSGYRGARVARENDLNDLAEILGLQLKSDI